jgi:diacylglycerol kinase family enzyme
MLRHIAPNTTYCMKTSKYLPVIMVASALWILADIGSSARSWSHNFSSIESKFVKSLDRAQTKVLAQNSPSVTTSIDSNKDLRLQDITIVRNSSDKSLLTVSGSISNRGEQPHYVYYIVAKFIAKDISIKQAIIPVNIDIEPGKSQPFTHEISTGSTNSVAPETVKPVVVKYEYR